MPISLTSTSKKQRRILNLLSFFAVWKGMWKGPCRGKFAIYFIDFCVPLLRQCLRSSCSWEFLYPLLDFSLLLAREVASLSEFGFSAGTRGEVCICVCEWVYVNECMCVCVYACMCLCMGGHQWGSTNPQQICDKSLLLLILLRSHRKLQIFF